MSRRIRSICMAVCCLTALLRPLSAPAGEEGAGGGQPATPPTLQVKPAIEIRKNDLWIGYEQFGGQTLPGNSWVPMHLIVTNNTKDIFEADMGFTLADRMGTQVHTTDYETPVVLAGRGATKHIVTHIYVPEVTADFGMTSDGFNVVVRFRNRTHMVADRMVSVPAVHERVEIPNSDIGQQGHRKRYFLTMGPRMSSAPIERTLPRRGIALPEKWVTVNGRRNSLPRRWIGYDAFSAIVWDGTDLTALDPAPAKAIQDYVAAGGHLVVCVGENRNAVSRSFLRDMLPCTLGEMEQADLGQRLLGLSGIKQASACNLTPLPGALSLAGGEGRASSSRWTTEPDPSPLAVRGEWGAGTVTVLAFSLQSGFLRDSRFGDDSGAPRGTWQAWSAPVFGRPVDPLQGTNGDSIRRECFNYLRESATKRIPSRATIAAFLVIYLLVLVPLTYVIFRSQQRLELAWVAMPIISCLFFAYMFYVALGDLDENLSITDLTIARVSSGGRAGANTASMLYNPSYRSYNLEFPNPTAAPEPLRLNISYDDPHYRLYGEQEQSINLSEIRGRGSVRDFTIQFDSKRPLSVRSVVNLGDGFGPRLNRPSLEQAQPELTIGTVDNRSNIYYPHAALVWRGEAVRLGPVVPGPEAVLQIARDADLTDRSPVAVFRQMEMRSLRPGIGKVLAAAAEVQIGDDTRPYLVLMQNYAAQAWVVEEQRLPSNGLMILFVPCAYDNQEAAAMPSRL